MINSIAWKDISSKVHEESINVHKKPSNIHNDTSTTNNSNNYCSQEGQLHNGSFNLLKKTKGLIFGHLNVRSIKSGTKFDEIKLNLQQQPIIHLMCFTETWLKETWSDEMLAIPNYSFTRKDRINTTRGGGLICYIHNSIPFSERSDLISDELEAICVELKPPYVSPIHVLNIYRPPSSDSYYDDQLYKTIENVSKQNKEFIVQGDFNINLLNHQSRSNSLIKRLQVLDLHQLINDPTRVEAKCINGKVNLTTSLIDHVYTSHKRNIALVHVAKLSISDHYPTLIARRPNAMNRVKTGKHSTINYRSTKTFDKEMFRQDIQNAPWDTIQSMEDPSLALSKWYDIYNEIIDKHTPIRKKRVKSVQLPPWLTNEILTDIKTRDNLKHRAKTDPIIWSDYKTLRNQVTHNIRTSKRKYFEENIVKHKDHPKMLWRTLKNAININPKRSVPTCP